MRPCDYWAVARAYTNAERDRLVFEANNIRQLAAVIVNVLSKKKVKKLAELWHLPGDENEKAEFDANSVTREQRRQQISGLLNRAKYGKQVNGKGRK